MIETLLILFFVAITSFILGAGSTVFLCCRTGNFEGVTLNCRKPIIHMQYRNIDTASIEMETMALE